MARLGLEAKVHIFLLAYSTVGLGAFLLAILLSAEKFHQAERTTKLSTYFNHVENSLSTQLEIMSQDLMLIQNAYPLSNYTGENRDNSIPSDASMREWEALMKDLFVGLIKTRQEYLQVRFLTFSDGVKEMIRVDKSKDGILVKKGDELQVKGHRPYAVKASQLSEGEVALTQIDENIEFGQPTGDIVIRLLSPIYDTNKRPFGFFIINASFSFLTKNIQDKFYDTGMFVTDQKDMLLRSVQIHESLVDTVLRNETKTNSYKILFNKDEYTILRKTFHPFVKTSGDIYLKTYFVARELTYSELFWTLGTKAIILWVVLNMAALFVSILFGRRVMKPIRTLQNYVNEIANGHLPIGLNQLKTEPELRALASSTHEMAMKINEKNQQLEFEKEKFKKTDIRKSKFLSNVSHELRTPLNSLKLTAKILLENKEGTLTEKQLENVRSINHSSNDLHLLINDLLDHSKIEKGVIDIEISNVNIKEMAENIKVLFQNQFDFKGVSFQCHITQLKKMSITTDQYRVEQIIRNLVSNALKFTPTGGLVSLEFLDTQDGQLQISVSDNGIGMDHKKLNLIFDPFLQLTEGKKKKHQGTGLGLSISRQLASALSGKIEVTSELGQGSKFTLMLPDMNLLRGETLNNNNQDNILSVQIADDIQISDEDRLILKNTTLLLVDDDLRSIFAMRQILLEYELEIFQAKCGTEALEEARKNNHIDLALIDIMMAEMNGYELASILRETNSTSHIRLIAISGHARKDENFEKSPFSELLSKPVDIEIMLKAIISVMKNKEAADETKNISNR